MKHFTDEEWIDFARNSLPREKQSLVQSHLDTGCKTCAQSLNIWPKFIRTLKKENEFEPPSELVQQVKLLFRPKSIEVERNAIGVMGQLLFDSFTQPMTVGVRGIDPSTRQMLYSRGKLHVDIKLEYEENTNNMRIIGQLQDSTMQKDPLPTFRVALCADGHVALTTNTNEIGEFCFVGKRNKGQHLTIVNTADNNQKIKIELPEDTGKKN